jgi:hypothetical protein
MLRVGSTRTNVSVDIYNVFNGNTVLQVNNNFTTWQQPQGIMQARFVKFSVQFDF